MKVNGSMTVGHEQIGKRAFKLFKTNAFTSPEVAQMLGVDEGTVMREFKKYCGDRFVFPGIYLVGGKDDEIVEAFNANDRVLVRGREGSGKTINTRSALKKIGGKVKRITTLEELDKLCAVQYDGIIFLDDVDCYAKKDASALLALVSSSGMRMVATATQEINFPGFKNVDLKQLTPGEINMIAKSKGWTVPKNVGSLSSLAKVNSLGGCGGAPSSSGAGSTISRARSVLNGERMENITKPELEQVFRNAYEIDAKATMNSIGAFVGAWLCFQNGVDYSAATCTVPKIKGAAAVIYRKAVV